MAWRVGDVMLKSGEKGNQAREKDERDNMSMIIQQIKTEREKTYDRVSMEKLIIALSVCTHLSTLVIVRIERVVSTF